MWSRVQLLVLRVEYRAERRCRLPAVKGAMLHGILGRAFSHVGCFSPSACQPQGSLQRTCLGIDRCVHGALHAPNGPQPRPFILTVPAGERQVYAPGDTLEFGLTLVGRGRVWLPWVLWGLGAVSGFGPDRDPFRLSRVSSMGPDGTFA